MDEIRFDQLTVALATARSRREALRVLLVSAAAVSIEILRPETGVTESSEEQDCALQQFPTEDTRFVGKTIKADVDFFKSLLEVDACAKSTDDENFQVYITKSYRNPKENEEAGGAPGSAHLAGHAIDFRLLYTNDEGDVVECRGKYPNGRGVGCLGQPCPDLPVAVQQFIKCVRDLAGLRWGGDFANFDPVHIDDGLTSKNKPALYQKRVKAVQSSEQFTLKHGSACPSGAVCDTILGSATFGQCVRDCSDCSTACCNNRCCPEGEHCCAGVCKANCNEGQYLCPCDRTCYSNQVECVAYCLRCVDICRPPRPGECVCPSGEAPCPDERGGGCCPSGATCCTDDSQCGAGTKCGIGNCCEQACPTEMGGGFCSAYEKCCFPLRDEVGPHCAAPDDTCCPPEMGGGHCGDGTSQTMCCYPHPEEPNYPTCADPFYDACCPPERGGSCLQGQPCCNSDGDCPPLRCKSAPIGNLFVTRFGAAVFDLRPMHAFELPHLRTARSLERAAIAGTNAPSRLNDGVEALELGTGVGSGEAPVDAHRGPVSGDDPCDHLSFQCRTVAESSVEALPLEHTQLDAAR